MEFKCREVTDRFAPAVEFGKVSDGEGVLRDGDSNSIPV